MTHSIWSHLCEPPTLTASTKRYAHIVYESTAQLHQSIEPILSALNRRAMALSKSANFEAALRDANVIQQLSPSSPVGYICAAKVYGEQGKQRHAIDICNQGFAVIDRTDPHYDTLQRIKMDAEQRNNTRIDFISRLPVDIVITTLIPLFLNDILVIILKHNPFLSVSHTWLDRIVQSLGGLPFFIVSNEDATLQRVIRLSRHIKELSVRDYIKGTWLGDLLLNNDFSSLKRLEIQSFESKHINYFLASLRSVSNTLTDLELDMEGGPALDILDVMMACPNLISLSICHIRRVNVISQPMTTWPALTKLSVKYPDNAIACDQIIGIWKRFPSLKKLELDTCTDISSTFIVPDYRPSMKSLELKMSFTGPELTYTDKGDHNDEPGLTKLIIEPLDLEPGETCKDTSSIIKRYHNTLEHLEWDMDTSQDTENIEDIHYPRLKKLALCWSGWQIPRNAPLIEDLTLSSRIIQPHPEVLDTIQPHLRKLELDLEGVPQVVHKSSILLYLSRVALRCQLKELVLRLNSTDHFIDILNAIYRHAHLECLKISFTRDWDYDGMERFFDGLVKRCPRLSCLELRCPNAPSIQSLNTLKRHTHLQQVAFSIRGTDNWDYFWDTLRTFSQLKRIRMYPWSKALEDKVNYLKRQRPDLKIIYSRYGSSHF